MVRSIVILNEAKNLAIEAHKTLRLLSRTQGDIYFLLDALNARPYVPTYFTV